MDIERPDRGFMFWPVGTGDSTTICVDEETVIQVDLHGRSDAENDETPYVAVIEELKELLPKKAGKPYLSVFALTHPDQDHCRGFERLLDEVEIGELWASPRVFRDNKVELCDDACAFREEMERRRNATIDAAGDPGPGNRLRVFGWDDLLKEEDWSGFPENRLTIPGNAVSELDGADYEGVFSAFIHAPFKDDSAGERNDASLGMQVTLLDGEGAGRALLLGDLCYPTIRAIFDRSDDDDLRWDVLLAPHHCSKSVMYWKGEEDDEPKLKQDILDDLEKAAEERGWVVSSSDPVPSSNESGDNPPHAVAKERYEEIVPDDFICTQEHPNEESPEVLYFDVDPDGIALRAPGGQKQALKSSGWGPAVAAARGQAKPPTQQVGFGRP